MSAPNPLADVPPPSEAVIDLTCVDLFFSAIFVPLGGYIAWKHGKRAKSTWPNLPGAAIFRIIADIYLLVNKDKPLIPSVVSGLTNASVLASILLTLVGVVYFCNKILPMPPKRKVEKYILIAMHLSTTAGLSMGFVMNRTLQIVGTTILVILILSVCVWMWPTYQKIQRYAAVGHPNAVPARNMFWSGVIATPFWMVRLVYGLVFAITQDPMLDTVLGSFTVKFIIVFWMYLGSMITLLIGGWFGIGWQKEVGTTIDYLGDQDETTWDRERRRTMRRARRRLMYGNDEELGPDGTRMTTEVVRPKASHASSMTMYTTGNSLHAAPSTRPLRPKPSHASSTFADSNLHSSASYRPLRPKASQASSSLVENNLRSPASTRPLLSKTSQASQAFTLVEGSPRARSMSRPPRRSQETDSTLD